MKKKKAAKRAKSKAGSGGKRAAGGRKSDAIVRKDLIDVLKGGSAHVRFMDALDGFPPNKRGTFAPGLPHTGWQLLEHSRIAQSSTFRRVSRRAIGRKRRGRHRKRSGRKAWSNFSAIWKR